MKDTSALRQNKQLEKDFFDQLGAEQEYNVFSELANNKIIATVVQLLKARPTATILDLGCGSGVFTQLLWQRGFHCIGVDLSHALLQLGKKQHHAISFLQGDAETLPFADNSVDCVMLSCLIHHLPDPTRCAREVYRILKPAGTFVAFDPNRLNPFMYLYRDHSSPFYSAKGVTPNERPVMPQRVRQVFTQAGLTAHSCFVEGLSFRYVASSSAKSFLPIYNVFDRYFFKPFWMRIFRAFVFTYGFK